MNFTASGIGRVMVCKASALLPHVGFASSDADRGHARHAYLEAIPKVGVEAALAAVPERHREECARIDVEGLAELLKPGVAAQEVAFLFNAHTGDGREVGRSIGRAYPERQAGEIAGTADVVALLADGETVYVGDWKGVDPSTPHASENLQMRFLALAAARTYGRSQARVELIHLREDGSHYRTRADLDSLDLDTFETELRELVTWLEKRAESGEVTDPVEGPHCKRCPAFAYCPAKVRLAHELGRLAAVPDGETPLSGETSEMMAAFVAGAEASLTLEVAARVLAKLEAGEQLLAHVRERLEQYAREHPFPTGRGEELFGPVEETKESPEATQAAIALAEAFDPMCAQAAVETKTCTSWDRINKAVSAWVKRQPKEQKLKVGDAQKQARELLRARRALVTKKYTRVMRHTPELALPAGEAGAALPPPPEVLPQAEAPVAS